MLRLFDLPGQSAEQRDHHVRALQMDVADDVGQLRPVQNDLVRRHVSRHDDVDHVPHQQQEGEGGCKACRASARMALLDDAEVAGGALGRQPTARIQVTDRETSCAVSPAAVPSLQSIRSSDAAARRIATTHLVSLEIAGPVTFLRNRRSHSAFARSFLGTRLTRRARFHLVVHVTLLAHALPYVLGSTDGCRRFLRSGEGLHAFCAS